MNFSEKRRLSRLLSLILVLALSVTLFAGCSKKKEDTPENDTSNPGLNLDLTGTGNPAATTPAAPTETTAPEVNENTATVTSQLNIRSSPSTEATVVGTLYAGDKVEISRREEVTGIDWAYIISPEAGWIVMEFVEMDIPQEAPPAENTSTPAATANTEATQPTGSTGTTTNTEGTRGVITATTLYIRETPSTDGKTVGGYVKGDVVSILETKNGWGRTNKGWIKMDYVSTTGGTTGNNNTNTSNTNTNTNTGNGSTTVILKGIVVAGELNIRDSASTNGNRIGKYSYGDRVEVLEKSNGWGRTSKGWISLDYVWQDGTDSTNAVSGTVTGNGLNIRSGPGTGYASVGSYNKGDSVKILNRFTYNGVTWGCTNKGWVSMQYVDIGSADNGSTDNNTNTGGNTNAYQITASTLRIREGAGKNYEIVGSLKKGDVVSITEQKTVDGVTWGKIAQGWISMQYVKAY